MSVIAIQQQAAANAVLPVARLRAELQSSAVVVIDLQNGDPSCATWQVISSLAGDLPDFRKEFAESIAKLVVDRLKGEASANI